MNTRSDGSQSSYHALEVSFRSRQNKTTGLQFLANYTWSHAIDDMSSTFGDSYLLSHVAFGILGFQDPYNPKGDLGSSDFDVRHRFVASFNWDVPFARNTKGVMKQILDGWSTNAVLTFRTGYPFTVFDVEQAGNNGSDAIRPTLVGPMPTVGTGAPGTQAGTFTYLPYTSFATTPNLIGPFINTVPRNAFRAPGLQTWNMSVSKAFPITERVRIQLRGELFNIFNHPNKFIFPGSNDFASASATTVMVGGTSTTNANTEQHRNIQLAARFIF